jgi:chemotaxis protein methyltransferase CheR
MLQKEQLTFIIQQLKYYSGYDLSNYAVGSLLRRVQRVMINQKMDVTQIIRSIQTDPVFAKNFLEDITVNTTELFRDPKIWKFLRTNTFLDLQKRNRINIWIAGCSTGQEAYSLAILLNEMGLLTQSSIFASDINTKVLDIAHKGVYRYRNNLDYLSNFDAVIKHNPLNYDDYSSVDYEKYFTIDRVADKIIMNDFLRKKIVFLEHDLVKSQSLSFGKFDLISCRNVLIYLDQTLQSRILNGFYNTLHPNSYLLLGVHESILGPSSLKFKKKGVIYNNK